MDLSEAYEQVRIPKIAMHDGGPFGTLQEAAPFAYQPPASLAISKLCPG